MSRIWWLMAGATAALLVSIFIQDADFIVEDGLLWFSVLVLLFLSNFLYRESKIAAVLKVLIPVVLYISLIAFIRCQSEDCLGGAIFILWGATVLSLHIIIVSGFTTYALTHSLKKALLVSVSVILLLLSLYGGWKYYQKSDERHYKRQFQEQIGSITFEHPHIKQSFAHYKEDGSLYSGYTCPGKEGDVLFLNATPLSASVTLLEEYLAIAQELEFIIRQTEIAHYPATIIEFPKGSHGEGTIQTIYIKYDQELIVIQGCFLPKQHYLEIVNTLLIKKG